jgi:predicted nucleotidyltransferase
VNGPSVSNQNPDQQELLKQLAGSLASIPDVLAVALGGSFARGATHPDADIDIGIYYSETWPPKIEKFRALARNSTIAAHVGM